MKSRERLPLICRAVVLAIVSVALLSCATPPPGPDVEADIPHHVGGWPCDRSPLLVRNVRLYGANDLGEGVAVLIVDGRIRWLGPDRDAPLDDEPRIVDGESSMALPGLIDSHTHFDSLAAAKHRQAEMDTAIEIFPLTMRQTLASGVTTARVHLAALEDMALMRAISDDECSPAPRLVMSGPGLVGGAPEVDAPLMRGVAGPEDARRKLEELSDLGAAWVALHGIERFPEEELDAIFEGAAQHGLSVMAACDSFDSLATAAERPVRSCEYIDRSLAPRYPDEVLAHLEAREAPFFVVPPLGYYTRVGELSRQEAVTLATEVLSFTPSELAREMRASFAEALAKDEYVAKSIAAYPTYARKLAQLESADVMVVAGSDSGSLGQFPHDAIWHELAALEAHGLSRDRVVSAATSTAAALLGRDDVGVLEVGAHGDLVLLRTDPARGGLSRESVVAVIKGGVLFVADGEWVGPDTAQVTRAIEAYRAQLQKNRAR